MSKKLKSMAHKAPSLPGVYEFKNKHKQTLYIGKAKQLKKRVLSYFSKKCHHSKIQSMLKQAHFIDYHITANEEEALILEDEMIKKNQPFYNTLLKDDKRFPWIKITLQDEYPAIFKTQQVLNDGASYFGPFPHTQHVYDLINQVILLYKIRDCKKNVSSTRKVPDCLSAQINRCLAPCTHSCTLKQYNNNIDQACIFLEQKHDEFIKKMKEEMHLASQNLNFEKAIQIRNSLEALKQIKRTHQHLSSSIPIHTLNKLQKKISLEKIPHRIDCFDISHLSGSFPVASRSVFINCIPEKKLYRHYKMNNQIGINDVQMIYDAVKKSYTNKKQDSPDLIVIDGGKGQLQYAYKALCQLKLNIPLIAIAKKFELIFTLNNKSPIDLGKYSNERKLLQTIRNEAHRFAVTFHRKKRQKSTLISFFENIPFIGKQTTIKILTHFQTPQDIFKKTPQQLKEMDFLNKRQIESLMKYKDQHDF